jgi:membrane-associated protease RseP (regulator of RpoE activity)
MTLAAALVAILFAHEMGHYLACVRYGVDATLPYFIPLPILSLIGTLGAFIRIRAPIPNRRALFDIGIAGPLAGFVATLPILVLGINEARLGPSQPDVETLSFGEPLLLRAAVRILHGPLPPDTTVYIGALGLAAWFGLFVTALNLLPIGQLDGGHVTYALFERRSWPISRAASWVCLLLTYFGPNWLVWSLLLRLLGRRHPPTLDDRDDPGPRRRVVGLIGALVFAVCFVPDPFQWSWKTFFAGLGF